MENYYSRLNSWLFEKEKGKVSIKGNATLRTEISEELAISIRSILRGKGYKLAVVDASWPYIKNYPQLRTRVRGGGGNVLRETALHAAQLTTFPPGESASIFDKSIPLRFPRFPSLLRAHL